MLERQKVNNMHAMHYFQCAHQLLEKVSFWKSYDLDNILIEDNKIYKLLNKDDFLSVDELPRKTKNYNCNIDDINVGLQNLHYEGVTSQR